MLATPTSSRAFPSTQAGHLISFGLGLGLVDVQPTQKNAPILKQAYSRGVQYAFKDSMIHGKQFTLRIAFRCVLHRCESQEIRCQKLFFLVSIVHLVNRSKPVLSCLVSDSSRAPKRAHSNQSKSTLQREPHSRQNKH
jgi:hypothetical protein